MELFLDIVTNCGALVLALMGVAVSFNPPESKDRRRQWRWFWGFAVVGAVVTIAQVWASARGRAAQEEFETKMTGGNNYAFFQAESKVAPSGEYYVLMTTTGSLPPFYCSVRTVSTAGDVIGNREWGFPPLPKVTARFPHTTLPPGRYRLDCLMGEKSWR